jgi:paraquat-inducible protein A
MTTARARRKNCGFNTLPFCAREYLTQDVSKELRKIVWFDSLVRGLPVTYPAPTVQNRTVRLFLVKAHPRAGWAIVLLLALAMAFFIAGLLLPFTAVTKLWLFENQISVVRGLQILWQSGELFLFLILFVFTVIFPFVKISAMLILWLYPQLDSAHARKLFDFVSSLGKWSMLDVFVVAILVLTVKSGGLASIKVGNGFFLFFLSVMLTQIGSWWTG